MNSQQVVAGLGWSALATVVSAVGQVGFVVVLARLLDPAAFGLMAMATLTLRFASVFSHGGLSQTLVQKLNISAQDTTAALLMALTISGSLYAVMALAAPFFSQGFRSDELTVLIRVLGCSLVLSSLSALPLALLRRGGRFKRVTAIELFSFVIGYGGVGMLCASRGLGVWSLVAATLSQQGLLFFLAFMSVRYPLVWPVPRSTYAAAWASGSRYSMVGFLEFLFSTFESFFIGRQFGKVPLGGYNRAAMLTTLPVELAVTAVTKVLFPALASMQKEPRRLASGFQILLLCIGIFSTALACGISAASSDVVSLLLGAQWAEIAALVSVLAFAVPLAFMYTACGVTLDSLAALKPKLKLQAASLLVKLILVWWMADQGLVGVAVAVVLAEALRLVLGLVLVARLLSIKRTHLFGLVALFAFVGLTVMVAVGLSASATASLGLPLLARVVIETLMGAGALFICVLLLTLRFPRYAPLQQFDSIQRWHARWLQALHLLRFREGQP
jgi:lipopolysaccharide exporter